MLTSSYSEIVYHPVFPYYFFSKPIRNLQKIKRWNHRLNRRGWRRTCGNHRYFFIVIYYSHLSLPSNLVAACLSPSSRFLIMDFQNELPRGNFLCCKYCVCRIWQKPVTVWLQQNYLKPCNAIRLGRCEQRPDDQNYRVIWINDFPK